MNSEGLVSTGGKLPQYVHVFLGLQHQSPAQLRGTHAPEYPSSTLAPQNFPGLVGCNLLLPLNLDTGFCACS